MLTEEQKKEHLHQLITAFQKLNEQEVMHLAESLFTPKELSDLANRWVTIRLLNQGMAQRKIASALGISLCKITRGSRELKKANSPFLKALQVNNLRNEKISNVS